MSEIWRSQGILVYETWVDTIISEASDQLSNWEITFIESLRNRLTMKRDLTELQAKKLESIYAKHAN